MLDTLCMVEKKRDRLTCVASPTGTGTGWFSALGPKFGGTIFARSLPALRDQAEAIAEKFGKELLFEVQLPVNAEIKVRNALAARQLAETTEADAQSRLADAVREVAKAGLSTRDAAVVLKLSHQRMHQLFEKYRSK